MIMKFQANAKSLAQLLEQSDPSSSYYEKKLSQLQNEQKSIQKFEESINNADSVLKIELSNWTSDFIKMKIQFYEKQQNFKVEFYSKKQNQDGIKLKNLNSEIIKFINESVWKESYQHFVEFIKHKVLFDFNLE